MDIQSIEIGRINVCVVLFCNRYSSSNNVQFSPFDSFHNFPSIRLGSIHNIQDMLGTIFHLTKVSQNSVYSPAKNTISVTRMSLPLGRILIAYIFPSTSILILQVRGTVLYYYCTDQAKNK